MLKTRVKAQYKDRMTLPLHCPSSPRPYDCFQRPESSLSIVHTAPLYFRVCLYRSDRGRSAGHTVCRLGEHMNFKGTTHIPREE